VTVILDVVESGAVRGVTSSESNPALQPFATCVARTLATALRSESLPTGPPATIPFLIRHRHLSAPP
jgi:hypothetical protein